MIGKVTGGKKNLVLIVTGLQGADMVPVKARDCGLVLENYSDSRC